MKATIAYREKPNGKTKVFTKVGNQKQWSTTFNQRLSAQRSIKKAVAELKKVGYEVKVMRLP